MADNNLEEFAKVVSDKTKWPNVPKDRFDRRAAFLKAAVAKLPPKPVPAVAPTGTATTAAAGPKK